MIAFVNIIFKKKRATASLQHAVRIHGLPALEKSRGMAAPNIKNRQSSSVNCKYVWIVACLLVREAV